jgi:hypothetical protein
MIAVFISAEAHQTSVHDVHATLDALGISPLTRTDVFNVLINPFVEKYHTVFEYARQEICGGDEGTKGMDNFEITKLAEDVTVKCLEIGCKVSARVDGPTILDSQLMATVVG